MRSPALLEVAQRHDATPAQITIAWALRQPCMIAIPKASDLDHLRQNAAAASIQLTAADLSTIDAVYLKPKKKGPLQML